MTDNYTPADGSDDSWDLGGCVDWLRRRQITRGRTNRCPNQIGDWLHDPSPHPARSDRSCDAEYDHDGYLQPPDRDECRLRATGLLDQGAIDRHTEYGGLGGVLLEVGLQRSQPSLRIEVAFSLEPALDVAVADRRIAADLVRVVGVDDPVDEGDGTAVDVIDEHVVS